MIKGSGSDCYKAFNKVGITIKTLFFIFFSTALGEEALADKVVKCKLASGKTVYQSATCPSEAVSQNIVEIKKQTPSQVEEARSKLKDWQAKQVAEEEAKIKAANKLQEQIERQETINALNRNSIARQQQAIAAQRQAEELGRQRDRYHRLYAVPPSR